MTIRLRCRCGWEGSFEPDQEGLQFPCTECGRTIRVTRDPAEFSTYNLGDDDLQLAPLEEVGEEETRESRPKGRAGGTRRARRNAPPAWAEPPPRRGPLQRRTRITKNRSSMPVIVGLVLFVVVGGFSFFTYRSWNRSESLRSAKETAATVVEYLERERSAALRDHFHRDGDVDTLLREMDALRRGEAITSTLVSVQEPGGRFSIPTRFETLHRLANEQTSFRLTLVLTPDAAGQWRVKRSTLAEETGAQKFLGS